MRERRKLDVDCVKIVVSGGGYTPGSNPRSQQYGLETLRAAVDEAHRLGLPVLAHSLTAVSNRMCAEAGVDTIIHGGVWWTEYPIRDRAYDYDPAVADLIAAKGIWVDPTIGEVELHREYHEAGRTDKPEFEHWALPDVPSELEPRLDFMRDMAERGVRFIGGMGMGMPIVDFDSVACSAQVYARLLGFEPWRAIAAITVDAAEALGLAETTGAIRPGLAADLVAVEGDPIDGPVRAAAGPRRRPGRPARSCATAGRWSEGELLGPALRKAAITASTAAIVEVLGIEPEDPGLGLVVAHHHDRVGRGEGADDLDRAPTVDPLVDADDRHRDGPAVRPGRAPIRAVRPGIRASSAASRSRDLRPAPSYGRLVVARHSDAARRAGRRSPPCRSSSSARSRSAAAGRGPRSRAASDGSRWPA